MNSLIASFKRYFIFAFLVLLFVFLLWLKLAVAPKIPQEIPSTFPSPLPSIPEPLLFPKTQIQQAPNIIQNEQINLNYTGSFLKTPEKLPVYIPNEPTQITIDQATQYAKEFGLLGSPKIAESNNQNPSFFLWQEGKKVFSVGGSFPAIHFNNYAVLQYVSSPSGTINTSLLINRCRQELNRLSININNVDFDSPVFTYFKTDLHDTNTKEVELLETLVNTEASYFGVGLTYKLADIPVISDSFKNLPIFLVFDQTGNLLELTVYLFSPKTSTTSIKTTPFVRALESLNSKGVIFSAFSKEELNKKDLFIYNINSVDLSSVRIAYFLPVNFTPNIFPYYVFKGNAQDKENNSLVEVTVFLPINTED